MKKQILIFAAALLLLGAGGCRQRVPQSSSSPSSSSEATLQGTITDATMSTLTVEAGEGHLYGFTLTDSTKRETGSGIIIGDMVEVTYTGELDMQRVPQQVEVLLVRKIAQGEQEPSAVDAVPQSWQDGGIFSEYYSAAYTKLRAMTLEEKIGQMLLARCPKEHQEFYIQQYHLGGFVLFGRDFEALTTQQVQQRLAGYQKAASIPLVLATDEEGGQVVRLSSNPKLARQPFESPQRLYQQGGLEAVAQDAAVKARLLRQLGLNVNLAPVADVSTNPTDYIYARTTGLSAQETADYVATVVQATQQERISSTLKHFPGYGNNVNTHTGIALDQRPYDSFSTQDFKPFEAGIAKGARCVLVSHNIVKSMDATLPASLSPTVHEILRKQLGFTGIIFSDDLQMEAVKSLSNVMSPEVQAVQAGNDMLIVTDIKDSFERILLAVKDGTLEQSKIDHAVFRVLAWKQSWQRNPS